MGLSADPRRVQAPAVWTAPDWAQHPVIEDFYGRARPRRQRASSFYDVMSSPAHRVATTTLGAASAGYSGLNSDDSDENGVERGDSLAFSCSTDVSEEEEEGFTGYRHAGKVLKVFKVENAGFKGWEGLRKTQEFVPVPYASEEGGKRRRRVLENPQGGSGSELSPVGSLVLSDAESPGGLTPSSTASYSSSRLRVKLHETLAEIDARLDMEQELARTAQRVMKKAEVKADNHPNSMWTLLCGARPTTAASSDGLAFLYERLSVFVHNRALNQLQRHRRHVSGILQIISSHNPDLELTEKQLDSFEAADDMLGNDIKYTVLRKQMELLGTRMVKRKEALVHAKINNGNNCFDRPRVKNAMLRKLLEAVSWYRLVQVNSREESASSSVAAPPSTSSIEALSEMSVSTASSIMSSSRALQEFQVEKILNVLAGEDFYSDYNELMCRPDWWEIAQAHFENIIFSATESRVCQWMNQMSQDVAYASEEGLDEEFTGKRFSQRGLDDESTSSHPHGRRADWLQDPSPEQLIDFIDRLTHRIRREFDVGNDVSKSLHTFIQRTVFARISILGFSQRSLRDCQRKDKLWRKKCAELSGIAMENLGVPSELAAKIRSRLPSRRLSRSRKQRVYLIRAIEAFNGMTNVVPCDLLEELMHGVVILHHEAALVLGTTQFSVETFFPLLAYVLLHCHLPLIHAQLHQLENFAINGANANGEESYYVYCVHAAVEYVCNASPSALPAVPPTSHDSETGLQSVAPMSAISSVGVEISNKLSEELKAPVSPAVSTLGPERSSLA